MKRLNVLIIAILVDLGTSAQVTVFHCYQKAVMPRDAKFFTPKTASFDVTISERHTQFKLDGDPIDLIRVVGSDTTISYPDGERKMRWRAFNERGDLYQLEMQFDANGTRLWIDYLAGAGPNAVLLLDLKYVKEKSITASHQKKPIVFHCYRSGPIAKETNAYVPGPSDFNVYLYNERITLRMGGEPVVLWAIPGSATTVNNPDGSQKQKWLVHNKAGDTLSVDFLTDQNNIRLLIYGDGNTILRFDLHLVER